MLLNRDEAEITLKSVKVGVIAILSATPAPKSHQKFMEKEPFQVEASFWMYVYFKSMFCDEVSQCVIKVLSQDTEESASFTKNNRPVQLKCRVSLFIYFSFSFEQQGVLVFNTDNRYLLPNLNKVFRLWFFSLQQGNNWFLNRGLRCGSGPVYFPWRGIWSSLHMLVLIRVWLLAGVSSPWLPSLGGDCERNRRDRWEASRRARITDWEGNACWCSWRMRGWPSGMKTRGEFFFVSLILLAPFLGTEPQE